VSTATFGFACLVLRLPHPHYLYGVPTSVVVILSSECSCFLFFAERSLPHLFPPVGLARPPVMEGFYQVLKPTAFSRRPLSPPREPAKNPPLIEIFQGSFFVFFSCRGSRPFLTCQSPVPHFLPTVWVNVVTGFSMKPYPTLLPGERNPPLLPQTHFCSAGDAFFSYPHPLKTPSDGGLRSPHPQFSCCAFDHLLARLSGAFPFPRFFFGQTPNKFVFPSAKMVTELTLFGT